MKLLTVAAASRVLGLSPQTLAHRISRGHLPVARYKPTRVRLSDLLAYAEHMPVVRPYGGRPRAADALTKKLAKLSLLSQAEAHAQSMKWS